MEEYKPGYGFRPYDDELAGYFLRHKILGNTGLVEGSISEVNINSSDPWDLRYKSKIKSREPFWYFFSRVENSGNRQSRRTPSGFWKVTGNPVEVVDQRGVWCDRVKGKKIGEKRVVVFRLGTSADNDKTDWVIHEFHYTLLPEHEQESYVICRLEYQGDDIRILEENATQPMTDNFHRNMNNNNNSSGSVVNQLVVGNSGIYSQFDSTPTFLPSMTYSAGSVVNQQSLQANSGSHNTFPGFDSANQFSPNFNMQEQPAQGYTDTWDQLFNSATENWGQWLGEDLNMQQQQALGTYEDEQQMLWTSLGRENLEESIGGRITSLYENRNDHQPKNPVTGSFSDSDDSDTDSMNGVDTSSSTASVVSSNESYHTPADETTTIEPQEKQPKQLKLQLQDKEKVMMIYKQKSECECKMAQDLLKKAQAPSTTLVKQKWIVLDQINQRNSSKWNYLKNMIIALLFFISIISSRMIL